MYLNDIQRKSFYAALGLDAREYDIEVIKKTNESAGRLFPIILDVEDGTIEGGTVLKELGVNSIDRVEILMELVWRHDRDACLELSTKLNPT